VKAVIVAKDNGYGLSLDIELLKRGLVEAGVNVTCNRPENRGLFSTFFGKSEFDIVIHLERVFPNWFKAAPKNVLIPNQERFPKRHIGRLRKIDLVLAKTRHAEEVYAKLNVKTIHTGFTSRDRFLPDAAKNWNRFFHLAGGSTLKGTEDILALWARHPEWPELVLVQKAANAPKRVPANVTLMASHIDDAELQRLQNECGVHLCPSRSEGWGHHLHEAMSCAAVVITTDAPPMNEFVNSENGILVPCARQEPRHLGTIFYVDQYALERAINSAHAMSANNKQMIGQIARRSFLRNNIVFSDKITLVVDKVLGKEQLLLASQ
jgi:glycosyltransferase involved in cell wall biosynthesis